MPVVLTWCTPADVVRDFENMSVASKSESQLAEEMHHYRERAMDAEGTNVTPHNPSDEVLVRAWLPRS
jgi:hypothetical protein